MLDVAVIVEVAFGVEVEDAMDGGDVEEAPCGEVGDALGGVEVDEVVRGVGSEHPLIGVVVTHSLVDVDVAAPIDVEVDALASADAEDVLAGVVATHSLVDVAAADGLDEFWAEVTLVDVETGDAPASESRWVVPNIIAAEAGKTMRSQLNTQRYQRDRVFDTFGPFPIP